MYHPLKSVKSFQPPERSVTKTCYIRHYNSALLQQLSVYMGSIQTGACWSSSSDDNRLPQLHYGKCGNYYFSRLEYLDSRVSAASVWIIETLAFADQHSFIKVKYKLFKDLWAGSFRGRNLHGLRRKFGQVLLL